MEGERAAAYQAANRGPRHGPRQKRKPKRKSRPDATASKPASGKTNAEVLEQIRCKFRPTDSGAPVKALR